MPKKIDTVSFFDPQTGERTIKQVEVDVLDNAMVDKTIKFNHAGKIVEVVISDKPGEHSAFVVFRKNPTHKLLARGEWDALSQAALEVFAAQEGYNATGFYSDPVSALNRKVEYVPG